MSDVIYYIYVKKMSQHSRELEIKNRRFAKTLEYHPLIRTQGNKEPFKMMNYLAARYSEECVPINIFQSNDKV